MSLADRIKAATPPSALTLDQWLRDLSPVDQTAVTDMAQNPAWTNTAVVAFLHDEGVKVGKDRVATWRSSHGFRR